MERGVEERVGWFESVTSKPDGVYADLHCIKSHPFTPILMEIAERNPAMIGLSHNADGVETVQKNGERLVESIDRVISVDLVQKPATNSSLFESEEPMPQTLKKFVESIDAKHPLRTGLSRLLEEDPVMSDLPAPEMPAASSSEDQIKAAFRQAVMAAFDDESLDSKATVVTAAAIADDREVWLYPCSGAPGATAALTEAGGLSYARVAGALTTIGAQWNGAAVTFTTAAGWATADVVGPGRLTLGGVEVLRVDGGAATRRLRIKLRRAVSAPGDHRRAAPITAAG